MENVNPPAPEDVARVIATARLTMPQAPVPAPRCMRPKGGHRNRTDMLAVKTGVNAMGFPADEAFG